MCTDLITTNSHVWLNICGVMMFVEQVFSRCFFFQAEDGIRYLVRSRGLGDVYKRQVGNSRRWRGQGAIIRDH